MSSNADKDQWRLEWMTEDREVYIAITASEINVTRMSIACPTNHTVVNIFDLEIFDWPWPWRISERTQRNFMRSTHAFSWTIACAIGVCLRSPQYSLHTVSWKKMASHCKHFYPCLSTFSRAMRSMCFIQCKPEFLEVNAFKCRTANDNKVLWWYSTSLDILRNFRATLRCALFHEPLHSFPER